LTIASHGINAWCPKPCQARNGFPYDLFQTWLTTMAASTWKIFSFEDLQETPGFITCDDLSEKIKIIICWVVELTTLFLMMCL
jgi:hypothetical protein